MWRNRDAGVSIDLPIRPTLMSDTRPVEPVMGQGPCSFPGCQRGSGFNPCEYYMGTANECLNCGHTWSYHA